MRADFVDRLGQADAALGVGAEFGEVPLPRPPAWICALTTQNGPGSLPAAYGFLDAHRGMTRGDGHAIFGEQFLGLIFVDVHGSSRVKRFDGP